MKGPYRTALRSGAAAHVFFAGLARFETAEPPNKPLVQAPKGQGRAAGIGPGIGHHSQGRGYQSTITITSDSDSARPRKPYKVPLEAAIN